MERAIASEPEVEMAPIADAQLNNMLRQNTVAAAAMHAPKSGIITNAVKDKSPRSDSVVYSRGSTIKTQDGDKNPFGRQC